MRHLAALTVLISLTGGFSAPAAGTGTSEDLVKSEWDFYLCRVDDAPASIFLDLALWDYSANAKETTLYVLQIDMLQPGPHRMGDATEAAALYRVEDALAEDAKELGLRYIGRLRNHGVWQATFMGLPGQADEFRAVASRHLADSQRRFDLVSQADSNWSYYREFLYPDDERLRWILDRRVVEQLEKNGDSLEARRRVDHWITFPDAQRREACAAAAASQGFKAVPRKRDETEPGIFLQLFRVDSVQLEDIHAVTTLLTDLAVAHGGTYDGWETSVEK